MKTVMKKMFSLLLVAVLLVGVMPFQASASEVTHSINLANLEANKTYSVDELFASNYSGSYKTYWVHHLNTADYGVGDSFEAIEGVTYILYVVEDVADSTPVTYTCSTCGETYTGSAHTCPTETCSTCQTVYTKGTSHTCPTETCSTCQTVYTKGTSHTCPTETCSTCLVTYTKGTAHTCAQVAVTFIDQVNGTTVTNSYYPGNSISLSTPAWVSGYEFLGWMVSGSSDYLGSTYTVPAGVTSITINAKWQQTTVTATYPVKVYARLHTGDVVTDVVEIHSNNTMLSGDKVLSYLTHKDTMATLWNVINAKYSDYDWSENFYNAYGERAATDNITTVNGSKSVYINLYSEATQVLVYVYTQSTCETYNYLYEMDGYKIGGPAIRGSEVLSFLKQKFGSNITIKMFDDDGFADYVSGKPNTQTDYVTVTSNPTKIHVRLYTTSTSTSSSTTADSSNPKTGDMVFAPAAVLGLSASALAVLFFLNKKRAF